MSENKVSKGNQELSYKKVRRFSKKTKKSEGLLSPETSEASASVLEKSRNKFWKYFFVLKLGIWIMIIGLFIYFFRLYLY